MVLSLESLGDGLRVRSTGALGTVSRAFGRPRVCGGVGIDQRGYTQLVGSCHDLLGRELCRKSFKPSQRFRRARGTDGLKEIRCADFVHFVFDGRNGHDECQARV